MADIKLSPPPKRDDARFDDWMFRLWKKLENVEPTSTTVTAPTQTQDHAELTNLNSASYTHLTSTQAGDLTDGGESSLHYHSADRSRASHTGTQTASTISDFDSAVTALMTGSILESQVFGS